jgi:hypothetical protein
VHVRCQPAIGRHRRRGRLGQFRSEHKGSLPLDRGIERRLAARDRGGKWGRRWHGRLQCGSQPWSGADGDDRRGRQAVHGVTGGGRDRASLAGPPAATVPVVNLITLASCRCARAAHPGEVAEWFKAAVLKTVEVERLPGVRIPSSPPLLARPRQNSKKIVSLRRESEGGENRGDASPDNV